MIRRAGRAGNGGLEVTQDYRIGLKDHCSSFLRRQECGFTFEVQHLVGENFSRSIIPQALARGIVVGLDQLAKAFLGQGSQVGLAGQEAAHSADGVLHPPFLPGGADIAEEGLDTPGMELVMPGELGAVVEGDTLAPLGREGGQDGSHCLGDGVSGLAWGAPGDEQTGVTFVEGEDHLTVGTKEHQVGLPVAGTPALGGVPGPLAQGPALGDEGGWAATPASPVAPFGLGSGR